MSQFDFDVEQIGSLQVSRSWKCRPITNGTIIEADFEANMQLK